MLNKSCIKNPVNPVKESVFIYEVRGRFYYEAKDLIPDRQNEKSWTGACLSSLIRILCLKMRFENQLITKTCEYEKIP